MENDLKTYKVTFDLTGIIEMQVHAKDSNEAQKIAMAQYDNIARGDIQPIMSRVSAIEEINDDDKTELVVDDIVVDPLDYDICQASTTKENWRRILRRLGYNETQTKYVIDAMDYAKNIRFMLSAHKSGNHAMLAAEIKGDSRYQLEETNVPLTENENNQLLQKFPKR